MIDSHFHLFHMKKRGMDYINMIKSCFDEGLSYAVDIGITPENFAVRTETASSIPGLYTAHGFYPSRCTSADLEAELEILEATLDSDPKAIAVGEMGIDLFHDYGTVEQQRELVRKQITIANRLNLPVIIHSRDAETETLELLTVERVNAGGIIHCYSYSTETAERFIELGYYISFAGNVTYKKTELLREAAQSVPLNRLLIETDAPYLSPQKVRSKLNYPGFIGHTYENIAELRGIPLEELITAVKTNFETLFNLPR